MPKLSLTVPVGAREIPSSFASRLAAKNFVSARDLCKDFGLSFQKIVDGNEVEIGRLATLGGVNCDDLVANAIRKTGSGYELRGQKINKKSIRRARVYTCPICIRDDIAAGEQPPEVAPYARREWALASIRTCAEHSIRLIEIARDLRPSQMHDFSRNIAAAVPKIDRLADEAPRRPASGLETYLLDRICSRFRFPWLDSLAFHAAAWTTEIIGAVAKFGKHVNFDSLTDDDKYQAGAVGFEITKRGIAGIHDLMSELKCRRLPGKQKSGLQATYGKLYLCYSQSLEDRAYDPVRDAIANHILAHFPLGPGDELFGRPIDARRFHSLRTASTTYRMHPKRLRKLLQAEGLVPDHSLKDRDVLFDAAVADRLFKRENDSLTTKQAEKYLNAPRPLPKVLLAAGLIRRHSFGHNGLHEVFFRSELDDFLTALFRNAQTVTTAMADQSDISTAAKRANCSTSEVVRLILDDRLTQVRRLAGVRGLGAVLVNFEEIRALTRLPELGGLTPAEAVGALRVNERVMAKLLRLGVFKTFVQRHPIKRNPQVVIPLEEIERFKSEFTSLFLLARERGEHMPILLRKLTALGVQAAPELKGTGATFFRRSALPF